MRDKFSELINAGVAAFEYRPIAGNIPEQDPIARAYNNIFSIPTDTHMSLLDDGKRVITGHIINTPKWDNFVYASHWGNVDFTTTGYWSLCNFLDYNGLMMNKTIINGDVVVEVIEKPVDMTGGSIPTPTTSFTTSESRIPQPISLLVEDNNSIRFNKCFEGTQNLYQVVDNLNKDIYIKGNEWLVYENQIIGRVNNKTCILNIKNKK